MSRCTHLALILSLAACERAEPTTNSTRPEPIATAAAAQATPVEHAVVEPAPAPIVAPAPPPAPAVAAPVRAKPQVTARKRLLVPPPVQAIQVEPSRTATPSIELLKERTEFRARSRAYRPWPGEREALRIQLLGKKTVEPAATEAATPPSAPAAGTEK